MNSRAKFQTLLCVELEKICVASFSSRLECRHGIASTTKIQQINRLNFLPSIFDTVPVWYCCLSSVSITFPYRQIILRGIGVASPWDNCPYVKSNANTFVRAGAYRVFLTSCVGINLGDIPRGLRHPWDVPSVDPSTLGQKTLFELASLKYCYTALQ